MKAFGNILSAILFTAVVALAPGIVRDSLADQQAKIEIAQINHVMYGMLSVNAWKGKIADIMVAEIGQLDLKAAASKLRGTIEDELTALIDKLSEQLKEENKKTFGGRIKQLFIDLIVDVKAIKQGIPRYTDAIIDQLGKPETQATIKTAAAQQLKTYLNKSYTEQNMEPVNRILEQTGTDSIEAATQKLTNDISGRQKSLDQRGYAIVILAILLFAWAAFPRNRTPFTVSILFATLVVLVFLGVTLPMIDLEAKISEMSFVLVGHKVSFQNQTIYFQSKSVINVFWLLVKSQDFKMKAVGILVITFSIVFPILKMAASIAYFFSERLRKSRVVQFIAFKIGKWSMADVMVIAIFMAYIGFNGIVESQFATMKKAVPAEVSFFTTNGTTLQMGYYIFIVYVLLAMLLSSYVHSSHGPIERAPRGLKS